MSDDGKLQALAAPFPASEVQWRVGATSHDKKNGIAVPYVDAQQIADRLDEVLGPDGWTKEHQMLNDTMMCKLCIRIGDNWVCKTDGAPETDIEPKKGAISNSFKRAARMWGVARYLGKIKGPWVKLDNKRIAESELPKLSALLDGRKTAAPAANTQRQQPAPQQQKPASKVDPEKLKKSAHYAAINAELLACKYAEDVDVLLDRYGQDIADMPASWQPRWKVIVEKKRKELRAFEAASA